MNAVVLTQLYEACQLFGGEDAGPPPDLQSLNELRAFFATTLTATVKGEEIHKDDSVCCICQCSFLPEEGQPAPAERPVRLTCGHLLGQDCAKTWFSSLQEGVLRVPEEFNTTCPYCRAEQVQFTNIELLNDQNRQMWAMLGGCIASIINAASHTDEHELAVDIINTHLGGFERALAILDRLLLTKWYVFRRYERANLVQEYQARAVNNLWRASEMELPHRDWTSILRSRSTVANFLPERLELARRLPIPVPTSTSDDIPMEMKTLLGFTSPMMLPSRLWKTAYQIYESTAQGQFTAEELDRIKIEVLHFAAYPVLDKV